MTAPWDFYWLSPGIGLLASLALLWIGAHMLLRREATTSLFAKDESGMLIAKAIAGGIILLSGLVAFFWSLASLLAN